MSALDQLANMLTGLGGSPDFGLNIPLTANSLAQSLDVGALFTRSLIDQIGRVSLRASTGAPPSLRLTSDLSFKLVINGSLEVNVAIPATSTSSNLTLDDLVIDVSTALVAALQSTDFAGMVEARSQDGRLTLAAKSSSISSMKITGASSLGFAALDEVNGLAFATIQQLRTALSRALNVAESQLGLNYNATTKELTLQLPTVTATLPGKAANVAFQFNMGSLSNLQTSAQASLTSRLDIGPGMVLGFELIPLGQSFTLALTSALSGLNAGSGVTIESDKAQHLAVTLSNNATFNVDLRGSNTIQDIINKIEAASRVGTGTPRVAVTLDVENDRLKVVDNTFSSTSTAKFKIAAANGSLAAFGLGLLGRDDDGLGYLFANRSMVNRLQIASIYAMRRLSVPSMPLSTI